MKVKKAVSGGGPEMTQKMAGLQAQAERDRGLHLRFTIVGRVLGVTTR